MRSQLQTYGASQANLSMSYTINKASLQIGHYDNVGPSAITAVNGGGTSNSSSGGDMANRIVSPSQSKSYKATVVCQNNGQQQEVEILFSFGL
jgi:hypothetical protein